jgi:hypothetical protein
MRWLTMLPVLACVLLASCGKPNPQLLVGKWKKDDGKTIEFRENGTMTVVKDGVAHDRRYEFRDGRRIIFDVMPDAPGTEMEWGVKHLDAERLVITMWDGDTGFEYRRER